MRAYVLPAALAVAAAVLILSGSVAGPCGCAAPDKATPAKPPEAQRPEPAENRPAPTGAVSAKLPKLVDLGADKCIPCKKMAPILEELKTALAGRLEVVFLDVWKDPAAAKEYGIKVIPTQIFYGPDGKELFRHEGFFSKEEILGKWKELGFDLGVGK